MPRKILRQQKQTSEAPAAPPVRDDLAAALEAADNEQDYVNTKAAIYKLVDTFAGITKKKIWIVNGNLAQTDGRQITAPLDDPNAYLLVEHEVSHILFKSNAMAKGAFVEKWVKNVIKVAKRSNVEVREELLTSAINLIVNVLEDHRVNSLWGVLYPGSFVRILRMSQEICERHLDYGAFNLPAFFMFLECGLDVTFDRFEPYKRHMVEALQKVELRSFGATLAISKWLIMRLVDVLIEQALQNTGSEASPDVSTRSEALDRLLNDFRQTPEKLEDKSADFDSPPHPTWEEKREAEDLAEQVIHTKADNLVSYAESTAEEMRSIVEQARRSIRQKMTKEQFLRKGAFARVVFRDVGPADLDLNLLNWERAMEAKDGLKKLIKITVEPIRSNQLKEKLAAVEDFILHDGEDRDTVRRLQAVFCRALGKRRLTLDDEGSEIDVQAFIEHKLTQSSQPLFKQQLPGRGFKAMVLLDRSISMEGSKTIQTERACKILAQALRFPFVDLTVWGFQALEDGQIDVIRYAPGMRAFATSHRDVGGGTPLHIATRVALRHLEQGQDAKHLFILTDGFPSFANRQGRIVPTLQLVRWTREEIRRARSHGVNITGILVGTAIGSKVDFELTPTQLGFMFGRRQNWRLVNPKFLGRDLVKVVTSSFLSYLSH